MRALTTVLLSAFLAAHLGVAAGAEPAAPAGPPPPCPLAEPEYAKRLELALDGLDVAALARSQPPVAGLELIKIAPDSQAERLGLAVGERMIDLDGTAVDGIEEFSVVRHLDMAQKLTVWNREAGRRVVQLAPGLAGISYVPVVPHLEAAYLAAGACSPAWDRAMVAAVLAMRVDPDLALSALAHAYAQGYRGAWLRAVQAEALAALGRYADASAAAELDLAGARAASGANALRTLYSAALVDGRLADAKAVLTRFPELRMDAGAFAPYLADLAARRAPAVNPLDAFAAARHYDLTGMMRVARRVARKGEDMTKALVDVRDHADTVDCTTPPGQCFWFEIALPAVDGLAFEIEYEAAFENAWYVQQHVNVSIGAPGDDQDLDPDFRLYAMDYTVRLNHLHDAIVYVRDLPCATVPIPRFEGLVNRYKLLIARQGGQIAWSLNGQRFGCQPIRGQVGAKSIYVYATSCHFAMRGMEITCFDAQPPAGWQPVKRKRTVVEAPAAQDPKGASGF